MGCGMSTCAERAQVRILHGEWEWACAMTLCALMDMCVGCVVCCVACARVHVCGAGSGSDLAQ